MNKIEFFKIDEDGYVCETVYARYIRRQHKNRIEFVYRFDFPNIPQKDIKAFVLDTLSRPIKNAHSYTTIVSFPPGKKGEVIARVDVFDAY